MLMLLVQEGQIKTLLKNRINVAAKVKQLISISNLPVSTFWAGGG